MKAKDYVIGFTARMNKLAKDIPAEDGQGDIADGAVESGIVSENLILAAGIDICLELIGEISELMKLRGTKDSSSLCSVIRELDKKWVAIATSLKEPELTSLLFRSVAASQNDDLTKMIDVSFNRAPSLRY